MHLFPTIILIVLWFPISFSQGSDQVQMHHNFDTRNKSIYYYVSKIQPHILWQQLNSTHDSQIFNPNYNWKSRNQQI